MPRLAHPPLSRALLVLSVLGLRGCNTQIAEGDCGPILSLPECRVVRAELGTLDDHPPADPTNRGAQWTATGTGTDDDAKAREDKAAALGQRLFFDKCLSGDKKTGCVTCHEPGAAFIDPRPREITVPVKIMQGGMPATVRLPPIQDPAPERVGIGPPAVQPQLDLGGVPLATWDGSKWHGVVRRPQSSRSAGQMNAMGGTDFFYTGRHSPGLYNVAYGAGAYPADGARTAGVTWGPWDGRYDSLWSLVSDVFEFKPNNRTDRAHIALRVFKNQKHRVLYEGVFGALPDLDAMDGAKYIYPRHATPGNAVNQKWQDCWNGKACAEPESLPIAADDRGKMVKAKLNEIFVNSGKALSAYMRRLRSGTSAYDRWLKNPADPMAMSAAAQRGLRLFVGKAECVLCHNGPNFTDWRFHNLGVPPFDPERRTAGSDAPLLPTANPPDCFPGTAPQPACPDPGRFAWQNKLAGRCAPDVDGQGMIRKDPNGMPVTHGCQRTDPMSCLGSGGQYNDSGDPQKCLPPAFFDRCEYKDAASCRGHSLCSWYDAAVASPDGGCRPRANPDEQGSFKTPSLRNVARTWPYMHNGAISDFGPAELGKVDPADPDADPTPHLLKVIEFYDRGGGMPITGSRDPLLRPLHLSQAERDDLVEFLKALTDESAGLMQGPDSLGQVPSDLSDVSDCPP